MSALSGERETDLFDELRDAFEGHWNAFHFRCPRPGRPGGHGAAVGLFGE